MLTEYNGDSGYEAESRKDGEEEEEHDGEEDILLDNDTADIITPSSLENSKYLYDISGLIADQGTPNCSSTPKKPLIDEKGDAT